MTSNPPPARYHLLLAIDGRPTLHGWWDDETVAHGKHTELVSEHGRPGVHVTLTDEDNGDTLATWPEPA
ncbi:hypothetical protein ACWDO7_22845 [Streptomyces sp. NPDC003656]